MPRKDELVDDLYRHCMTEENPSRFILENGTFPDGWIDTYLKLLDEAKELWQEEECWPRKLVLAIHFTSFYLEIRYRAWCKLCNDKNIKTQDLLGKIRTHSEMFFFAIRELYEEKNR